MRWPIAFVALMLGMACAATTARAQSYSHYDCNDGASIEVTMYPDRKFAYLQFDGKSLQLPKRLWVTGARYSKNGIVFWMKGERATIKRAGKASQCTLK